MKYLAALKIAWLIGKMMQLVILMTLVVAPVLAAEPFRFEPKIDPRPETVELPSPVDAESAGKAASGSIQPADIEVPHAPADPRPVCYVHTVKRLCKPCEAFGDWWLENCDTFPLRVEPVEYESFEALPHWVLARGVPLAHYESERTDTGWEARTWDAGKIMAQWTAANPKRGLPKPGAPLTSASPFDQIHKFTGPGGRFTFTPDSPIRASLDDRTTLSFPSIQGRYTVRDGKVELKLDPPLPVGNYRKFMNFGFQITGGGGPENVTASSMDLRLDTNRGSQRVTIQMEPVK